MPPTLGPEPVPEPAPGPAPVGLITGATLGGFCTVLAAGAGLLALLRGKRKREEQDLSKETVRKEKHISISCPTLLTFNYGRRSGQEIFLPRM
jgi:hypothetical protein